MNRVILTGRLTRDPESRMSQNNVEVARFSLACQNDFLNRNGERDTEFINCVAFNRLAGTINKYCRKGSLISITSRIRNSSYDAQDGSKRYTTDVVAEQMEFLGARNNNSSNSTVDFGPSEPVDNSYAYSPSPEANIETTDVSEDPYKDFGDEVTLSSDDLPF